MIIMKFILVANECAEDYWRRKQKEMIVKLDLEKVYDKTDWDFLGYYVLARKGFGVWWRSWIYGCPSFAHYAIISNGSPKAFSRPHEAFDKVILSVLSSLPRSRMFSAKSS